MRASKPCFKCRQKLEAQFQAILNPHTLVTLGPEPGLGLRVVNPHLSYRVVTWALNVGPQKRPLLSLYNARALTSEPFKEGKGWYGNT